ncbi:MAG: HD-GYP domain-containing protein [Desulfitobacteriaceae bacterium]
MRLVNVNYLKEGAVLARPVMNAMCQVLLQAGVKLTSSYISRLQDYGCEVVFIEDERLADVEIQPAISTPTRELAHKTLKQITGYIGTGRDNVLPIDQVRTAVEEMIEDLLNSRDIVGNLTEIQVYDEYTFQHSINTTVLALILALAAGYSESRLLELGMGVLMHDVGKIKVPDEILNKTAPLTLDEFDQIKKHTIYGYEILRKNRDFSLLSTHVAFQHQEKWDGSGYPRGLKGTEIHEYGRITAVADVFEALTSRRVYRPAFQPYKAFEYLMANSGTHFEPKIVDSFTKNVAIYPTGSGVRLSNGLRGNVVKQNQSFPSRPFVRALYEENSPLLAPIDLNLAEHPSLMIVKVENE